MTKKKKKPEPWRYGYEKLMLAVDGMALSTGPLPKRIGDAFFYHLLVTKRENFPASVWRTIESVHAAISKEPDPKGEGRVLATVRTMSEEEGRKLGTQLLEAWHEMCQAWINPNYDEAKR